MSFLGRSAGKSLLIRKSFLHPIANVTRLLSSFPNHEVVGMPALSPTMAAVRSLLGLILDFIFRHQPHLVSFLLMFQNHRRVPLANGW